jgi:hypothetical protein
MSELKLNIGRRPKVTFKYLRNLFGYFCYSLFLNTRYKTMYSIANMANATPTL